MTKLFAAIFLAVLALPATARADGCDALTVRLIRATGASLAGRTGPLVVFRAADAERMSLSCGRPNVVLLRSALREPNGFYFLLVGQAGHTLTGASVEAVETLAKTLHQATLLTGMVQTARLGPLDMECEPGDRPDGFHGGALCQITAATRRGRSRLSGERPAG